MEIQFQHHHVLTFCDQNKQNFSQILLKFFKPDERNRRKVDGDLEVAELDVEECAELDDEEEHAELDGHLEVAELDDEECAELDDDEECAELYGHLEVAELDDEECAEPDDEECAEPDDEECAEPDDEEEHAELDREEDYAESDDEEDYPKCCVCFEIVDDGPVYFCEICDAIWVHKFCASLPPEIRAHPLHFQRHHSLTLQTTKDFGSVHYCDCCRDFIRSPNYYNCSECGLTLDCECTLSPDNDDLQQITASLSPDTKTQISHDAHPHTLFLFNSRSRKKSAFFSNSCKLCDRELLGLTYGCFPCKFYLHKKCVEISQQECEVQHPCHSHHSVSVQYHRGKFICDQCRDLCSGFFMAICKTCDFKIGFKCAFLRDTTIQRSIGDDVKPQIRHFIHDLHLLIFFNYTNNFYLECEGCRLPLSGPCYGCLECSMYLHKSCAELPQIIKHPYHPSHNILLDGPKDFCRACGIVAKSLMYRCHLCPFFCLDTQCVINNLEVISALKNKEYHQHDLYYYFVPLEWIEDDRATFECNICSENCEGTLYTCLECKAYFHMECIGIPKEVKHDSHIHPLTLMAPLTEDDIDESKDQYYCYTCENKRNPRYHAYSCQQCANTGHIFTAHIECVLSTELNEIEHNHMIKEDDEEIINLEKFPDLCELSISPRCMRKLLIKDKLNDHILNYFEDITSFSCYLCKEFVENHSGYECSFCQIHLHKECAKLPFKIKHNLHEHPLSIQRGDFLKRFICDGCQVYHKSYMCYRCEECSFSLDKMCAQGISTTGNHYRKLNDNGSKVGFSHFSHKHKLRFAFILEKDKVNCSACMLLISGPTYCCYACYFFLHESCFNKLKSQYIQHHFHIQHPLHFKDRVVWCTACKKRSNVGYECAECDFELDIKCVKYLTSSLQHKCHEHKLFCFVAEDINDDKNSYWCEHCDQECNAFFYRCLDCGVNLHIECMSIPKNVKSACHVHPLTLMDSINEEGRDEYYCYACENLRNPKHAAYYCKECYYPAHIGCVLDEEEGEIEIL